VKKYLRTTLIYKLYQKENAITIYTSPSARMSTTYKSITTLCPRSCQTQENTQDTDESLDACLNALELNHKEQKVRNEKEKAYYPNKERTFLFDELFDDLIDKYVDDGFLTKNNRSGFFRALLPSMKIEKKKHTYDDTNKPSDGELED